MNSLSDTSVTFIGAGNIAWGLIHHFEQAGVQIPSIISRDIHKAERFAEAYEIPETIAYSQLTSDHLQADYLFLTVPDHAIETVAASLPPSKATLVHCSGSTPLSALSLWDGPTAVWYPLQIFTQLKVSQLKGIPVMLEGDEKVMPKLEALAQTISGNVQYINSEERLRIHAGGVFACNFPNHLFKIAAQMVPDQVEEGFSIYKPLIMELLKKAFEDGPELSQTGPAIRADHPTLAKHIEMLSKHPDWQQLYKDMSNMIRPDLEL